jgi:hypothetical protein
MRHRILLALLSVSSLAFGRNAAAQPPPHPRLIINPERIAQHGILPAGLHSVLWDATDRNGRRLGGGLYLYTLQALGQTKHGRVTVVR